MSKVLNGQDITREMAAAWGLPTNTKCIYIRIPADGIVEISADYYPDEESAGRLTGWLKQHQFHECERSVTGDGSTNG